MGLKASQRRTLKHQHAASPGGRRPEQKPRDFRDTPDSHDGLLKSGVACKNCRELRPREDFQGRSRSLFSWCIACRQCVTEAVCSRCKETKSREEFYEHPSRSIGLSSYCKDCSAASAKESVERSQAQRKTLSHAHRVRAENEEPGRCTAFLNLGSFTSLRVQCSRQAAVGGRCLTHASHDERRIGAALRRINAGTMKFGGETWQREHDIRRRHELTQAKAHPELGVLIAEQERDARRNQAGAPWMVSLNAQFGRDGEATLLDFVDQQGQLALGRGYTPDFSEAVCVAVDRRREIDAWAEEVAA